MKHLLIQIIGTGSTGNAYKINDGNSALLLDAGLPFRKIQEAIGFTASLLSGALITHEHGDHVRAARDLLDIGVPVYTSQGTAEAEMLSGHYLRIVEPLKSYTIGSYTIMPFDVEHDAVEPLGFLIKSNVTGAKLLYVTDTYRIKYRFKGITHLMIECNFVNDLLVDNVESSVVDYGNRLYGNHMELSTVVDFAASLDQDALQEVHLLHLSESNSDEKRMKEAVQKATGAAVYVAPKNFNNKRKRIRKNEV